MDKEKLEVELTQDEGRRTIPYQDTKGIWTGGIGHNLEAHGIPSAVIAAYCKSGISDGTIDLWFTNDINDAVKCCKSIFPNFDSLPDNVQRVLANMAFDLSYGLQDWHHLQDAVSKEDWNQAALSISDSKFAQQAPNRAHRLVARILE